jgi:uncharacterized membrane protein
MQEDLMSATWKPVTYGIMHFVVAVAVAYAITQDWRAALGVGILEPLVQTVAYTLHERAWHKTGTAEAVAASDPLRSTASA